MVTDHPVKMQVLLEPIGCPWTKIQIDDQCQIQQLTNTTEFNFEFVARDRCCLKIEHFEKSDNDPTTAVVIKKISFYEFIFYFRL